WPSRGGDRHSVPRQSRQGGCPGVARAAGGHSQRVRPGLHRELPERAAPTGEESGGAGHPGAPGALQEGWRASTAGAGRHARKTTCWAGVTLVASLFGAIACSHTSTAAPAGDEARTEKATGGAGEAGHEGAIRPKAEKGNHPPLAESPDQLLKPGAKA